MVQTGNIQNWKQNLNLYSTNIQGNFFIEQKIFILIQRTLKILAKKATDKFHFREIRLGNCFPLILYSGLIA